MMSTMHTTVNTKKHVIKIVFFIAIIFLIAVFCFIQYKRSQINYKLKKIGYSKDEISIIITSDKKTKSYILENDYNKELVLLINDTLYNSNNLESYLTFSNANKTKAETTVLLVNNNVTEYKENLELIFKEKYFIPNNLERYVTYYLNNNKTPTDTVSIVNVNADYKGYEFDHDTDMSKGNLILTNKYYKLKSDYTPTDLKELGIYSSWGSIRQEVYDAFLKMIKDAAKEGYTIRSVSPFRDYETQESIYNRGLSNYGLEYALKSIAKPGYSEHQTGLALDINSHTTTYINFALTKEFNWVQEHAHEYGFILRYPSGKEYLTGYKYESWHYRYLGVEVATKVKEAGITYDEYYAYYCEYKNEC